MSQIRTALTLIVLMSLAGGYAASQVAFWNGFAREWSKSVDQPIVSMLALTILVLMCVLTVVREHDEGRAEP